MCSDNCKPSWHINCFCVSTCCCAVPVHTGCDYSKSWLLVHSSSSWFCLLGQERLRGQTGDRVAYQHRRSKHACWYQNMQSSHNQTARSTRKEAGSVGERGKFRHINRYLSRQFRASVMASKKSLTLLWINNIAVLNSRHSWMLPHRVQRWASLSSSGSLIIQRQECLRICSVYT